MNRHRSAQYKRRGSIGRVLAVMLVIVGLLGFGVITTVIFGRVSGVEFAPDAFQRRSFTYYEIPLFGVQVWPLSRTDTTGAVEKHLTSTGVLPNAAKTPPSDWHLASLSRGISGGREGDSHILCIYLDMGGHNAKPFWLDWSIKNKTIAPILWNAVQELALAKLYVHIPDLLTMAQAPPDEKEFQSHVDKILAECYLSRARLESRQNNSKQASEWIEQGLKHADDDSEIRRQLLDFQKEIAFPAS